MYDHPRLTPRQKTILTSLRAHTVDMKTLSALTNSPAASVRRDMSSMRDYGYYIQYQAWLKTFELMAEPMPTIEKQSFPVVELNPSLLAANLSS